MPGNKYPEETVKKILDVSLTLFLEKGFEETTIIDIVNGSGLTRGAFYYHFKSKDEVLAALNDKLFFEDNPFLMPQDENLTGLEKIKKIIKQNFSNTERQAINIATIPLLKNPRFIAELLEANQKVIAPYIEELIVLGIDDGSIEANNAKALADAFLLIGNFWLIPSIFPGTQQELIDKLAVAKQMLDGAGLPVIDEEVMAYVKSNLRHK